MHSKTILLVEDDYLDVMSVQRTLNKLKLNHILKVAHNGVDALAILNGNNPEKVKIMPDIILLDINMPKMNGLEFLSIIKNYYSLKNIKVFIMTTSNEEYDHLMAQNLGVNGYILKPLDFTNVEKDNSATSILKELLINDSIN
ncbi:MAG: response regulator [Bacteroidota bacterium]